MQESFSFILHPSSFILLTSFILHPFENLVPELLSTTVE